MSDEEPETPPQGVSAIPELKDVGEIKIFKCPECTKTFTRESQFQKHASVHKQPAEFTCGSCEKLTSSGLSLIFHPRLYECGICQKKFARKDNLNRHLRNHPKQ